MGLESDFRGRNSRLDWSLELTVFESHVTRRHRFFSRRKSGQEELCITLPDSVSLKAI